MADYPVSTDIDTFMQSADKPAMRTNMDLGTAATKDVAATGDAASGEVVKGDDSRLTDARTPVSHTHTLSDVTDSGTAASKDVPATGDAAAGEVVLGNDSRLTDARTPTSHTHTASEVTDFDTEVANNSTVAANTSKLSGIEAGAEVNNISDTNATDLTDGGDSTLHYHSADRNRANHTGTQTLSTISDAGTIASQDANSVTITGGSVTGITDLAVADGGTGASTAAAARTNLEVYSDAEVDAKVATKAVAGGVEFSGTATSYVEIPTTSIGNIFTNEGSFSFYAKLKDLSLNYTIFDCRSSSNVGGFGVFYRNDGKIRLLHETSGSSLIGEAELIINENEWFHCVITHDGTVDSSAPIFFLNGVQLVTSAYITASGTIGTVPPSVGRFGEVVIGSSAPLLGSIKNPLFFNRALTATEVQELHDTNTVAVADRWGGKAGLMGASATNSDVDLSTFDATGSATVSSQTATGFTGLSIPNPITTSIVDGSDGLMANSANFVDGSNLIKLSFTISNFSGTGDVAVGFSGQSYPSTGAVLLGGNGDYVVYLDNTANNANARIKWVAVGGTADFDLSNFNAERAGCIADLPLDEGIGYQFHDRSSNHFDALASTSGVTHLVPKQIGKVRVKAADASSATYMLRTDSILPTDSIITEVLSEQCYVDLTNSAQVLDDYRIRLNPSLIDLQIQRSDGSNHQTLGTVTAPASLSNVDVEVQYKQVIR